MATKTRLPNNAIASLEDALVSCRDVRRALKAACQRAEDRADIATVAEIGKAYLAFENAARRVRDARHNQYEED